MLASAMITLSMRGRLGDSIEKYKRAPDEAVVGRKKWGVQPNQTT